MDGLLIAAQVEGVSTRRDHTVKIVLGSQEMTPIKAAELLGMANKLVAVYISPKETIDQKEILQVDQLDPDFPQAKTPSQRLRAVLWVLWDKVPEGFKDFESYYRYNMEKIIDNVKANIPA